MTNRNAHRMPRRKWSAGRGALTLIALLLVASGVLRISAGSGAAIALEVREQAQRILSTDAEETAETDPASIAEIAPELLQLLEETRAREVAVERREWEVEARAQTLALVEASISEDLLRLETAEAELRATMAAADAAAETDIARLTSVYENMKPDQASALFELMEPSFAAGFLGRMRPDAAAAIMAGLSPDLAYTISVVLAGRNADVPREPVPEGLPEPVQQ